MLPERLQTTLHMENVSFNVNGLCNLGPMPCYSRGSKQHFTGKNSGNSGNVVWTSGHALYLCIYQVLHVKKYIYKVIRSSTFYPANGQTFSRAVSKKVNLSARHAMLPKPMQSWPTVSVKCRDQDCISNLHWMEHDNWSGCYYIIPFSKP